MRLIPNARRAWRMLSVQMATAAAIFGLLPADQQIALLDLVHLPPERAPAALGILFIAARLWHQPKASEQ